MAGPRRTRELGACRALASATTARFLFGWRDARRGQTQQRPRDGSRDRLGRWFLEYPTWRGRPFGHPFVGSARLAGLSGRAQELVIAAQLAWISPTQV